MNRTKQETMEMPERRKWESHFGVEAYDSTIKRKTILPLMEEMNRKGLLGTVIVDAGSGPLLQAAQYRNQPMEERRAVYYPTEGKKIIRIDIGAGNSRLEEEGKFLVLNSDLEELQTPTFANRRNWARVRQFLGIRHGQRGKVVVDTVLLSDVLNYVDSRKVLGDLKEYLKPEGRFVIRNTPGRTVKMDLRHPRAPQSSHELPNWLARNGFEIEHVQHGLESHGFGKLDQNLQHWDPVILVARKRAEV